jgi:hypothetical protein
MKSLLLLLTLASGLRASDLDALDRKARRTVEDASVTSRVGPTTTPLPLELSNFLLDRPDLAAFLVRRRKIAPYRIAMRAPRESSADDGAGTRGVITLVERTDTHRVYYGEGVHHSRVFPDIKAEAVIVMDLAETASPACGPRTESAFTVSVRLNSRLVSALVKTLRPFVRRTIVAKFEKASAVAYKLGVLMAEDPESFVRDAAEFPGLSAEDLAVLKRLLMSLKAPPASCQ